MSELRVIPMADNIHLREISEADALAIFELVDKNRARLGRWMPWVEATNGPEDTAAFARHTQRERERTGALQCGIWIEKELAGIIGQHLIDWQHKSTSLGYWLGLEHEGKGLMTKACKEMIDHCFKQNELNRVEIAAASQNRKSRAIAERLGFTHEGRLRQKELVGQTFLDHEVYSLLRSEWEYESEH